MVLHISPASHTIFGGSGGGSVPEFAPEFAPLAIESVSESFTDSEYMQRQSVSGAMSGIGGHSYSGSENGCIVQTVEHGGIHKSTIAVTVSSKQ